MVEKAEQERVERELSEKKETLRKNLIETKTLTLEEIEASAEIKAMIEALDEAGIKSLIAEKVISSLKADADTPVKVEVSEVKAPPVIQASIVDSADGSADGKITSRDFITAYIG